MWKNGTLISKLRCLLPLATRFRPIAVRFCVLQDGDFEMAEPSRKKARRSLEEVEKYVQQLPGEKNTLDTLTFQFFVLLGIDTFRIRF